MIEKLDRLRSTMAVIVLTIDVMRSRSGIVGIAKVQRPGFKSTSLFHVFLRLRMIGAILYKEPTRCNFGSIVY